MSACVKRSGVVVGLETVRGETFAQVRMEAAPACAGCGSRQSCSAADAKGQLVSVLLDEPVAPGEPITLSLPESSIAVAALLGYLLPAVGLVLGAVLAGAIFSGDAAAVLGAILGLGAGVLIARALSRSSIGRDVAPSVCAPVQPINLSGDFS